MDHQGKSKWVHNFITNNAWQQVLEHVLLTSDFFAWNLQFELKKMDTF